MKQEEVFGNHYSRLLSICYQMQWAKALEFLTSDSVSVLNSRRLLMSTSNHLNSH